MNRTEVLVVIQLTGQKTVFFCDLHFLTFRTLSLDGENCNLRNFHLESPVVAAAPIAALTFPQTPCRSNPYSLQQNLKQTPKCTKQQYFCRHVLSLGVYTGSRRGFFSLSPVSFTAVSWKMGFRSVILYSSHLTSNSTSTALASCSNVVFTLNSSSGSTLAP